MEAMRLWIGGSVVDAPFTLPKQAVKRKSLTGVEARVRLFREKLDSILLMYYFDRVSLLRRNSYKKLYVPFLISLPSSPTHDPWYTRRNSPTHFPLFPTNKP